MLISRKEHTRVLECGVDVPEEKPSFPLPLSQVGISDKTVWVYFTDEHWGRLPFVAEILIDLPAEARGIHMSRIEQAITELHDQKFTDLREYAITLGDKVLDGQRARTGTVTLNGQVPLLQNTPVSKQISIDTVEINVSAQFIKRNTGKLEAEVMIGASLYHLTACPCTLAYNQVLFNQVDSPCPLATHSQRSKTQVLIESDLSDPSPSPSFEEVIDCLSSALHVAHDLLKRPDEAELVFRAHQRPQFAEDVVRQTAQAAGEKFRNRLPKTTRLIINSLSLESIHIHNVKCRLETSLNEILKIR